MDALEKLVNPYGSGAIVGFVLLLVAGMYGGVLVRRVYPNRNHPERLSAVAYAYGPVVGLAVVGGVMLVFTFPELDKADSPPYQFLVEGARGVAIGELVIMASVGLLALHAVLARRDRPYAYAFACTAFATVVATDYLCEVAFDRLYTYVFLRSGYGGVEAPDQSGFYLRLAGFGFLLLSAAGVLGYGELRRNRPRRSRPVLLPPADPPQQGESNYQPWWWPLQFLPMGFGWFLPINPPPPPPGPDKEPPT